MRTLSVRPTLVWSCFVSLLFILTPATAAAERPLTLGIGRITLEYDGTEAAFYLARFLKKHPVKVSCGRVAAQLVDYPADSEFAVFGKIRGSITPGYPKGFHSSLVGSLTLRARGRRSSITVSATVKLPGPHVNLRAALKPIWDKVVNEAQQAIEGSCLNGG